MTIKLAIVFAIVACIAVVVTIGAYQEGVSKATEANHEMDLAKKSKTLAEELQHIENARLAAHIG